MAKPIKFDEAGDSADLQALFDSIAAGPAPAPLAPEPDSSGDSDDLQALFDSVSEQLADFDADVAPQGTPDDAAEPGQGQEDVFNRLGHMTRKLHDSMRELGFDKALEDSARQIPDAMERLKYIADMTEQAAAKVLNAIDIAKPAQEEMAQRMKSLSAGWELMFANRLSVDQFKALAAETRGFFAEAQPKVDLTCAQLEEIMMAQGFQDLTGQVIKRVLEMVQNIEGQLLQVLIDVMPDERKAEAPASLMNGPVISAVGRSDVLTSQAQVDDLLESLGF